MHVANPVVVPTALSPLIERFDRVDREINPVLELKENLFLNLSAPCHCKWLIILQYHYSIKQTSNSNSSKIRIGVFRQFSAKLIGHHKSCVADTEENY